MYCDFSLSWIVDLLWINRVTSAETPYMSQPWLMHGPHTQSSTKVHTTPRNNRTRTMARSNYDLFSVGPS